MLKANLSTDIPENQRMNDLDVLVHKSLCLPHNDWTWTYSRGPYVPHHWTWNHQVYTIFSQAWFHDLRCHDSYMTMWALYALSIYSNVQSKLHNKLFTIQSDNPTIDELNSLLYLDSVVWEMLHIHSPVTGIVRVAVKDDVVPFEMLFVDKKEKVCNNILWVYQLLYSCCEDWTWQNDLCYIGCTRDR